MRRARVPTELEDYFAVRAALSLRAALRDGLIEQTMEGYRSDAGRQLLTRARAIGIPEGNA